MKPTFKNDRPVLRGESVRPARNTSSKSLVTDWNFQTTAADLRGSATSSHVSTAQPTATQSFYRLSAHVFSETNWADRIEGIGFTVVIALAACPVIQAIYVALRTV